MTGPSHAATFTLHADGSFDYTPVADFNGSDSFTYRVSDGAADSNTATVTISVSAIGDAPVAHGDSATLTEDSQDFPVDVLANDTDADNLVGPANAASRSRMCPIRCTVRRRSPLRV